MIKAVIFDMDGVLIEAKDWHYDALNKALGLFGFSINRYDHLTTYDGLPTPEKLEILSLEQGLPKELHKFINEMKQIYTIEIVNQQCKPTFVHEYALSRLKSLGYSLVCCSNSNRATVDIMMKKSGLDKYLDMTFSASDVNNPKPHPEIYLKAIDSLKLRPEECLIVEDNQNGIKAALESGANLLEVKEVHDTNFINITKKINSLQVS